MAKFLVTGGTGFIGKVLVGQFVADGHEVVVITRRPAKHTGSFGEAVKYIGKFSEISSTTVFQAIINLGGEGIGDKRWSKKRKQVLHSSRIELTEHLVKFLARLETRPVVLISGSAIGWYGSQDEKSLTEDSPFHEEFTHDICQDWEEVAGSVTDLGIRLCIVRLGLVLGRNGGVLKRMLPPFYFGLGGRMGSGKQIMSWVHMDDVIMAISFLVNDTRLRGVFNLTAPQAVSNAEFTKTLGKVISRPTIFPLPAMLLTVVFGEMGERLLLKGPNVVPQRLLDEGFSFEYPKLDEALSEILIC